MKPSIEIEPYVASDKADVSKLLSAANLPASDLNTEILENFLIAREPDGSVAGFIGMEVCNDVGLLRSLVVQPSQRNRGLGSLLANELEKMAVEKGIQSLYLLTTTAIEYFPKLGYQITLRETVPALIANTAEFKNICPQSAVCYSKILAPV